MIDNLTNLRNDLFWLCSILYIEIGILGFVLLDEFKEQRKLLTMILKSLEMWVNERKSM